MYHLDANKALGGKSSMGTTQEFHDLFGQILKAQLAGAVEYPECTSAKKYDAT